MLMLLALVLLLIPSSLRSTPFDSSIYEHEKIQNFRHFGFYTNDTLVSGGRTLIITPYDWLIMLVKLPNILPIIFGMLSVFFFSQLLKRIINDDKRFMALFILIFSPFFIFSFTLNNPFSLILLLNILGLYLFSKGLNAASSACYLLLVFFGAFNFILSILVLVILAFHLKIKVLKTAVLPSIAFIVYMAVLYAKGAVFYPELSFGVHNFISGVGSLKGMSIFAIILSVMGWVAYWRKTKNALVTLFALIMFSLFYNNAFSFVFPIISVLAGLGFLVLINYSWETEYLKKFTIFIFVLGLMFSVISYEAGVREELPSKDIINGLEFLKGISSQTDVVLSHPSRGLWVEVFAQRTVILDSNKYGITDFDKKFNDMKIMFHTYELAKVKELLSQYSVKYIVVDSEMKEGIVWEKENQELLYLLTDKNTFTKVYSNSDIEIWEFSQPSLNVTN